MLYEFILVVTDAEGDRIVHPVVCRGPQIVGIANRALDSRQASEVEVWLGDQHLHTLTNPTHPRVDWGVAA